MADNAEQYLQKWREDCRDVVLQRKTINTMFSALHKYCTSEPDQEHEQQAI